MYRLWSLLSIAIVAISGATYGQEFTLTQGWRFYRGDDAAASRVDYDDRHWQIVEVPHDWAITGPFDRKNDLQTVAVTQNYETTASVKTGRTGGLPYTGTGWYRRRLDLSGLDLRNQRVLLYFDRVMSESRVYVNGQEVAYWPYGYNAFHVDITGFIRSDAGNILAVRAENRPFSSRWYSGAGIYRNVKLIVKNRIHVPIWGVWITTPEVSGTRARIDVRTSIDNCSEEIRVRSRILDPHGVCVAEREERHEASTSLVEQSFEIEKPCLWSPEAPALYRFECEIRAHGEVVERTSSTFGIRSIGIVPEKGFYLNGQQRKFQGVCLHHDLGPLGAAVHRAAIRRQLTLLKEMGADAIRTSHNMPASELVELCDSMGFMVMVEPFDEWDVAKCENGYHRFFEEWAERDLMNMVHHFRNNPSVVMWSIGNEVPTQCEPAGSKVAEFLQGIIHREDPTRPVTCGMDRVDCVLNNGFAAVLDVPGLNYRTGVYQQAYESLPQKVVLGTETASTVSSRGVYKFPVEQRAAAVYDDHQSSSYDVEYCPWSNIPDADFALAEDFPWTMGQFVWTGFDYLGEPTPYDTDAWPSHSSLFGIIDLASIPKDRYYLYRSIWNRNEPTLHVLPHWTWPGREGKKTPVFVYSSYPEVELFVNGVSQGVRTRTRKTLMERYRLMWPDVVYEPGELKAVAYDSSKRAVDSVIVRTAGAPDRLCLTPDRTVIGGRRDLVYINVKMLDAAGHFVPTDCRTVRVKVSGAGRFKAMANGDPTSLEMFHMPQMHLFNGQLTVIVESLEPGDIIIEVQADGVKSDRLLVKAE